MQLSDKTVILLGHGVRLSGAAGLVPALLDLGIPVLTSWPAADLVDSDHPSYFGRPGVYGQRCANKVLANANMILAIGCRMSIWTVGYNFPLSHQRIVMVDVDKDEAERFPDAEWVQKDAKEFLQEFCGRGRASSAWGASRNMGGWRLDCASWREQFPWLEFPHHSDANGYINPHRFMSLLQAHIRKDETIVADCATGSLAAHQILRLKPPQRLMTSGGLGEMGCGLPGAIGASFARGKERVICLTSDGGMMLSVQELAVVKHHRLPLKIIVFCNDGYGMIKDTQRNLGYPRVGVDKASGVSFPDFVQLAHSFGIEAFRASEAGGIHDALEAFFSAIPLLMQVDIDPDYYWGPKLRPGKNPDGSLKHALFDEMSP